MAPALEDALARLESGTPAEQPRLATEPRSALEAVRAWLEARGARRGHHVASNAALLLGFEAHARDAGWELDSLTVGAMSRAMRALGYNAACQSGVRGWRVDRDTAAALRLLAPARKVRAPQPRRLATPRPRVASRLPFWPLHGLARPLVDSTGRVYPTARAAAAVLPRVSHQDVWHAVRHGTAISGRLWRQLAPHELKLVPPDARTGDVLSLLAWGGTVAVHCPGCCCQAEGRPPPPTPQVSHPHPGWSPVAGDPPHIP